MLYSESSAKISVEGTQSRNDGRNFKGVKRKELTVQKKQKEGSDQCRYFDKVLYKRRYVIKRMNA